MRSFGLIGILFWLGLMALLEKKKLIGRVRYEVGQCKKIYTPREAIFVFLPIILWAGFRSGQGYVDTNAYIRFFGDIPRGIAKVYYYIKNVYPEDPGFTLFAGVIKTIFGDDYTPFLLTIAIIQGWIVVKFFQQYSTNYLFSIFLFIGSLEYFSWMFNGLRQFLAVVIVLAGFRLYLEKKYFMYIIVVLIASTVHMSAIIMLPIALVVKGKPWNIRTLFFMVIAIAALVATSQFTDMLEMSMQNTQYSNAVSSWQETMDDGTNPIRVLMASIPTILALIGAKTLAKQDDLITNISINMSIVSTSLWVVSMVTSGIYMGRLPIYASLFNYILLPYEIDIIFNKRSAKLMKVLVIGMYLLYYYYQLHFAWGVI